MDSVSVVTDDKASVVNRFEYLPFGEAWDTSGDGLNRPKYCSAELDAETNFYYMNARYQDPGIGRFTTPDTVIDGEYSTQGWNRYSYCHNNPVRYKDPTGHTTEGTVAGGVLGSIFGPLGTAAGAVVGDYISDKFAGKSGGDGAAKAKTEQTMQKAKDSTTTRADAGDNGGKLLAPDYWQAKIDEYKASGDKRCNVHVGKWAAEENDYLPHRNANGQKAYLDTSDKVVKVPRRKDGELDHETIQKKANDGYDSLVAGDGHIAKITKGKWETGDEADNYSGTWKTNVPYAKGSVGGRDPIEGKVSNQYTPDQKDKIDYYYFKKDEDKK